MPSILAHPFNAELAAALGVKDLTGVRRITLVLEAFKCAEVHIERDLIDQLPVIQALTIKQVQPLP